MQSREYISLDEAAEVIGVTKPSLYYYVRILNIEKKKFPLDRKVYIKWEDFEKIKKLKDEAVNRGG
jgi:predicted DNA-binding transcriptional regulator AlpA